MSYFDSPRTQPRYRGVSDPIPNGASAAKSDMATCQALHRMWMEWATSPDREHWLPGPEVDLRVVTDDPQLFTRDQRVVAASAVGSAVLDADEMARMDAPPEAVRADRSREG